MNPYTFIISLFSAPYNRLPKLSLQKVYFRIQMIFFLWFVFNYNVVIFVIVWVCGLISKKDGCVCLYFLICFWMFKTKRTKRIKFFNCIRPSLKNQNKIISWLKKIKYKVFQYFHTKLISIFPPRWMAVWIPAKPPPYSILQDCYPSLVFLIFFGCHTKNHATYFHSNKLEFKT